METVQPVAIFTPTVYMEGWRMELQFSTLFYGRFSIPMVLGGLAIEHCRAESCRQRNKNKALPRVYVESGFALAIQGSPNH